MKGHVRLWQTPLLLSLFLVITVVFVSIWMSLKNIKGDMLLQISTFNSLNKTISTTYNEIIKMAKKERMENAKKISGILQKTFDNIIKITDDKDKIRDIAEGIIDSMYHLDKYGYSYLIDLKNGEVFAYPLRKTSFLAPKDIYIKIKDACPEKSISYQWYLPNSTQETTNMAYIKCMKNKDWAIGTSIYTEDVTNKIESLKLTFLMLLNIAAKPKHGYIDLEQYKTLPPDLKNIAIGKLVRCKRNYIAILRSSLYDLFYVYKASYLSAIKESLPYIFISVIILLIGVSFSLKLRADYEKHQIASDILDIISSNKIDYAHHQEALDAMKEKIKNIMDEMKNKEFIERLSIDLSTKSKLSEVLQTFLDNYKTFQVTGIQIFIKRSKDKRLSEILRKGQESSTAISHDETVENISLRIAVYTSNNAKPSDVYMITKGTSVLSKKIADILRSMIDPLTKIWNRHYVYEFLDEEWKNFDISAIMMLDLDKFKLVNDNYGHDEGDKVLKEFVRRIENAIRPDDIFIRWGGDEFLIVMRNIKKEFVCKTAERLRKIVENPPLHNEVNVTVSIGALIISNAFEGTFMKVLNIADDTLYEAKKRRNIAICKKV